MPHKKRLGLPSLLAADTETTGDQPEDQIVEAAMIEYRHGVARRWRSLITPRVPVKPEARAAHHLTDAELDDAPLLTAVLASYEGWLPRERDDLVLVAHNVEFDHKFLSDAGFWLPERHICTMVCARHLYEDAPRHSLQVLRYYLGIEVSPEGAPHRAMYDTEVCLALVRHMLLDHSVDDLVTLTGKPVIQRICTLKKYKGRPWTEVPADYMQWIVRQTDFGNQDAVNTARHHLNLRSGRML